ncbi:MAG: OmpH family outer membrane protein [Thermonemataceae bacterium]|nr:OmpH family outer membrane protein [Thermonemataceae bacterium]
MKKIFWILLIYLVQHASYAQKYGFIDANFILKKMPSYKKAQKELDEFAQKAQQEIDKKFAEVREMESKYITEELLLTDDMKREKRKKIEEKRKEAESLQQKTFGYEGLLFIKKQEIINPVREELQKAVEKVAKKKKLQVVFDKSSDFVIIYLEPAHDYTDYVLEELDLGDKEDNPKKNKGK